MQIDGKRTRTIVSACKENNCTFETMRSWDKVATQFGDIHKMTPQQGQAQFGNWWNVVQTTAGGSNTMPTRQHPELGQARRDRMNYQSAQAGDRHERTLLLLPQHAIKNLAIRAVAVENTHTHFLSPSHVYSCTTHPGCFSGSFVALPLSHCCCEEVVFRSWMEADQQLVCQKISLSRHTCSGSSISQIMLEQLHSQRFRLHLHCRHDID